MEKMSDDDNEGITLDLRKKSLKKVPKEENAQNVRTLLLDDNELQKIDNIDSYLRIEKLSLSKNQLLRMYGVCRLHCLRELNLSYNGILTIEGLKELIHLRQLNLEGNNIKTIEHLNTNINLELLNLSENSIGSITDISFLKNLKELYLHGNRLSHLKQCDKYLPISLEVLTLAKNNISDLNEICTLSHLCNLHTISINDNQCIQMAGRTDGFDHRPFVLNWCMSVKVIDGFVVDPIESLKAEWLYSQGRGRQFRIGDQDALAKYLSTVCPLFGKALENENERKLRLILSKAQQHQRQLQEEISENSNNSGNNSPSSGRRKPTSRIQSPRLVSRLSGRQRSPDTMSNSYHGNVSTNSFVSNNGTLSSTNHSLQMTTSLIENIKNDSLMTQSCDGTISLNSSPNINNTKNFLNSSQETIAPRTVTSNQYNDQQNPPLSMGNGPLASASKMVPVPESLMSPDCCPTSSVVVQRAIASPLPSQNQTRINKSKDNRSNSPKITRSPHLKRQTEKSPILSPRKVNNITNNSITSTPLTTKLSSNLIDNSSSSSKPSSRSISSCIELALSEGGGSTAISSDDDSDHINVEKLKTIRNKAAERAQNKKENLNLSSIKLNKQTETSAIIIQKIWRGYHTRKKTKYIAEKLLRKRTQLYIEKLTKDMEMTKTQLENERKIQQLQMQAINALWKKVSSLQPNQQQQHQQHQSLNSQDSSISLNRDSVSSSSKTISLDNSSAAVVNDLTKTCTILTNQVQQLQNSMRDILNWMTIFCNLPQENLKKAFNITVEDQKDTISTQTDIVAVHTPQLENLNNFPYKIRPSSLPLDTGAVDSSQQQEQPQKQQQINSVNKLNEKDSTAEDEKQTNEKNLSSSEKSDETKDKENNSIIICDDKNRDRDGNDDNVVGDENKKDDIKRNVENLRIHSNNENP